MVLLIYLINNSLKNGVLTLLSNFELNILLLLQNEIAIRM